MIKKQLYYDGEQKTREDRVWGIPFVFEKNVPQNIAEEFANNLLKKGIYKIVKPAFILEKARKEKLALKILIVRSLGGLGDVLMNTPVFRALKESISGCILTYACLPEYIPIVQNNEYLDLVIPYDRNEINSDDYDVIIDITRCCAAYEHLTKPNVDLHRSDIFLMEAGVTTENKRPFYNVEASEREEAKAYLKGKKFIGFQLKSAMEIRDWHINNFRALSELIIEKWGNINIIIFDKSLHVKWAGDKIISYIGQEIRKVAALIEQAEAMVTIDSGLMHLTGALARPQVTIFGNIDAACRTRYYPEAKVLQAKEALKCCPCWENYCPDLKCMKAITPSMVMTELEKII